MTATTDPSGAPPLVSHNTMEESLSSAFGGMLRHAQDLSTLSEGAPGRWSEALASETRTHLAGCLNAIGMAIGVRLGESWLAPCIDALGNAYCSHAIERQPGLLAIPVVQHVRQRAAIALMLRLAFEEPLREPVLLPAEDAAQAQDVADALVAYRLAIDPWFTPHAPELPMRADLPAEIFAELGWTAAALLIDGLARHGAVDPALSYPVVARAAEAVIARHDEQQGPFARATLVAALLREDGAVDRLAAEAMLDRDLLLFAALGAQRCGMALGLALTLLIDGEHAERIAFARLLDLPEEGLMALLAGLGPLAGGVDDAAIADAVEAYRILPADAAWTLLVRWAGPEPLVEKLVRLGRFAP